MADDAEGLEGRVAVVNGGARGLGRACALGFARAGASVVVCDIDLEAARMFGEALDAATVDAECRQLGVRSIGIQVDMRQPESALTAMGRIQEEFGHVDIVINAVGGHVSSGDTHASAMPIDQLDSVLALNLTTTVVACQAAVAFMARQRSGSIVNFSSGAATRVRADGTAAHYSIAKAAVEHYTRILAAEVGPLGIRVNAVAPGSILTSRSIAQGRAEPAQRARLEGNIALRRLGTPDDVALVVRFLASQHARYVTGQIISVCGGTNLHA